MAQTQVTGCPLTEIPQSTLSLITVFNLSFSLTERKQKLHSFKTSRGKRARRAQKGEDMLHYFIPHNPFV